MSCGLEADGTKKVIEIVSDVSIQAVQLGSLVGIEFGVSRVRPRQSGSERGIAVDTSTTSTTNRSGYQGQALA
ncbi:MAG TPA: hypothetical protein VIT00_13395 [Terrimicrobiaceae bacterium]